MRAVIPHGYEPNQGRGVAKTGATNFANADDELIHHMCKRRRLGVSDRRNHRKFREKRNEDSSERYS